jgi:maleate cis-trans isomerase
MSLRKRITTFEADFQMVVHDGEASIWAALRALKVTPRIIGFGRLLESLAA